MSRPTITGVFIAALMVLLAACQVNVGIGIELDADGSGTVEVEVRFDEAAIGALGDLEQQLRTEDARRAGWDVAIETGDESGAVVTASKSVPSSDDWQRVLDEIAGPDVFTEVEVVAEGRRHQLSFDLDLRGGWMLFADADVTNALGGEPFGAPLESLTEGRSMDDIVSVGLGVSVRSAGDGVPTVESFGPRFDDGVPLGVVVEAVGENSTAVLLRWISMALLFLFVVATVLAIIGIVLQRRSDRLRPPPTPAPLASRVPGRSPSPASGAAAHRATARRATAQRSESVRLVVIEPLTVLYHQGRVLDDFVLPFVRDRGGTARADAIATGYRSVLAGTVDTADFWERCGVAGEVGELDDDFVRRRVLHSGARSFFDEMQRRQIPVAAATNDAWAWSAKMRERDRLNDVWPWLVSSSVGALTSNIAMFEVLRRESSIAHSHCLYVDNDLASLDAAKELGMKTAFFDTGDVELPAIVGHAVVNDLKALFGSKR